MKTRGERPDGFQQRAQFGGMLQRIAAEDPAVHRALTEVNHLLIPPTVLREPPILEKVTALMATAS
ncbi:hypothetical protein [Bradyrhizobium sp. LA7.1]|uniref:hypothetical protein n=1 Tax=Bradyrhizobium sp. LA7.1 TaxID=3156324 RepID=UPI003399F082